MQNTILAIYLVIAAFITTGCLSTPDGFDCPPGSALRLDDVQWRCDTENPALPLPDTQIKRYVDATTGNDSNHGTAAQPWKTLVKAASTVTADTTVLIRSGVYDDGPIVIANSGSQGKPIIFKPDGFSLVTIKTNGILAIGKSHLAIAHLRFEDIRGHTGNGIRIEGRENQQQPASRNITIRGNTIVNTWSSGIAVWGVRWRKDPGDYNNISNVVIESNLLELNTNGGANEIITVANGASNIDVRYNTIRFGDFNADGEPDGTGDEGIDFKEGVKNSRIYANTIYDLSDTAIYIDGGRGENENGDAVYNPLNSNIDIFNNRIRDGYGSGIVISTEGQGDVSDVRIYNNIVERAKRDGIIAWQHPFGEIAGGTIDNIWIFNNTVIGSGQETLPGNRSWGGIRASHPSASVLIENNIAWDNIGFDINGYLKQNTGPAPNVEISNINLCRESSCDFSNNPRLTTDLTPTADSPALNNGVMPQQPAWKNNLPIFGDRDLCAVPRGQGSTWDLGALEILYNGVTPTPHALNRCLRD